MPANDDIDTSLKIAALFFSGFTGAVLTALVTTYRNKIQTITKRIYVSYISLPETIHGLNAQIALKNPALATPDQYVSNRLAIVQLYLTNSGNKDFSSFDFGINLPNENEIISVQCESDDRYHKVSSIPEITISSPSTQLDLVLVPFNRKDTYLITLVINAGERILKEDIRLSKTLPIKFADIEFTDISDKFSSLNVTFVLFQVIFATMWLFDNGKNKKFLFAMIISCAVYLLLIQYLEYRKRRRGKVGSPYAR